jgi:hypothetical protein
MNGKRNKAIVVILGANQHMKKIFLSIMVLAISISSFAERTDSIPADPADVSSVDGIIKALYDVISGPAGEKRNWDRMRTLFVYDARMMPTGKKQTGEGMIKTYSVEDYINGLGPVLEKSGFYETEIGRKTEQYGNIVHLFSTYESRKLETDAKPFMRGINSIQVWNDGKRWWILSILWESESKENPIPEKYIGKNN